MGPILVFRRKHEGNRSSHDHSAIDREDLGADSLDTVELVMALEEEFGHEIPDEQAEKLQSVGDVIKYIEDMQQK